MSRFVIDPDQSQVWIEGSSSVHAIRASATGLTGWIDWSLPHEGAAPAAGFAGEVHVAVDRLASGNALVDRETRRRIDAARYPEIVGTVTSAEWITPNRAAVVGDVTFRGEVRSVSGELAVSPDGARITVEGAQTFDVREWGLRPPRIGLLRVHPDVRVRIKAVADIVR